MKKVLFLVVAVVTLMFTSCKKEYTITVQSNNEEWGTVKGSGTYAKGAEISIEAIAKNGYKFVSWQDGNTDNPRSITVKSDETYIATFAAESGSGEEPIGEPIFSVSETQKVFFSPGNLQWSATNGGSSSTTHAVAGGGTAAGTWRFAPNQWEISGADNKNISSTYNGWIDLFGWGTSGYKQVPWYTSTKSTAYGDGEKDISGTNYDWGVYNAIINPKTRTTDAPGTWRTLTVDEWRYLLETRTTASGIRYAKALVNYVRGLIIVPDNWSNAIYTLDSTNISEATYLSNTISTNDWVEKLENAGCVFLPAACFRIESGYDSYLEDFGFYWSSSYGSDDSYSPDSEHAYALFFSSMSLLYADGLAGRATGQSVRLVRNSE